jgi:hypothetical protein
MPDPNPRQPETTDGTQESAPDRQRKPDASFVWPRDLNAPSIEKSDWGTDPEALRNA